MMRRLDQNVPLADDNLSDAGDEMKLPTPTDGGAKSQRTSADGERERRHLVLKSWWP